MGKSYLQTHPYIRRIVFGVFGLVALAALGSMFGWDRVAGWFEAGVRTFGVEIGATTEGVKQ